MKSVKALFALAIMLFSPVFWAGGSYFAVKIVQFTSNGSDFKFVANIVDAFNYDNSGCKSIQVIGSYDAQKWKHHTKLINEQIHMQSIELVAEAMEQNSSLNLGYIGAGFHPNGNCRYVSKGLFHDDNVVFSIYTDI